MKSRAAVAFAAGKPLEIVEVDLEGPKAGEVLIEIHAASIIDLSNDLPLVLEWVDSEERVARLLPTVEAMLQGGMITTDPVTIIHYEPHTDRDR